MRLTLMTAHSAATFFRHTALAEAISYLLLLFIAMPLKYVWGMPMAVKLIGSIHGGLFVLFGISLALAMWKARWSFGRGVMLFLASLVPLVPFWLDGRVKQWAQEAA
jgi:integral membrane protein